MILVKFLAFYFANIVVVLIHPNAHTHSHTHMQRCTRLHGHSPFRSQQFSRSLVKIV